MRNKDDNKAVALSTSKINCAWGPRDRRVEGGASALSPHLRMHSATLTPRGSPTDMDPRITAAWCKAVEVPIEKAFGGNLLDKFPWALSVKSTWVF